MEEGRFGDTRPPEVEKPGGRRSLPTAALCCAPAFPHPKVFTPKEIGDYPPAEQKEIMRAANGTISVMKALGRGTLSEPSAMIGSSNQWRHAPSLARDASQQIFKGVVEDLRWSGDLVTGTLSSSPHEDEESFKFMTAKAAKGYARGDGPLERGAAGLLPRGAMADGPLEDLIVPPDDVAPLPVEELSEEVDAMYANFATDMLRPRDEIPWSEMDQIKPYWSPTYPDKRSRMGLCLKLYRAKMIRFTGVCLSTLAMFTVVKSQVVEGGKVVRTLLRPVWDMRAGNMMWRPAPWVAMGSAASFTQIDLAGLPESVRLTSCCGDIPNFFYVLRNPDIFLPFFCFGDFSAQEFVEFAATFGEMITLPAGALFCAVSAVLMGWSWAPWVARPALERSWTSCTTHYTRERA